MALGGNPVFNGKNFRSQTQGAARGSVATDNNYMTPQQLQDLYTAPSAKASDMGRMTYDDVIMKTVFCLAVVLVGAAVPVFVLPGMATGLMILGALGGFVLGLVNSFKREPVPGLILAYAFLEGMFLGGLTAVLDAMYPGVGLQAVLGTLAVFAVTLVLFRSGKVRATPKAVRFFMIAIIGYAVFSLINVGLMIFGGVQDPWGLRGVELFGIPMGVFIGVLAIGLAAFSLIMDFTSIEQGVKAGAPERYSWTAAFGLTVTLVWLYVEIIRLLAILRGDD
ncbi:Bax inhibitor-1/YccA family protein [Arthrobacter zhangbolii]|uniref:Bax inhibitor-1/YccA family protein n=1 Tax=Arthrobacter zhangbolii TaxID=2886936 RepID=A0A9X1M7J0_9MICC|nr:MULTISPECIES: Bax inhibitor-1/YccA family protein [Arthrobacter]MCC3272898.1 Bax inhibitor-1/YccA family protein [Arthrobacter zhangbolii]MCC3295232.1 Bax inhibitor-1/YccA family protein [Arthrobacter zhangbolii]MDN3905330.1 Bax inhibitor-1/YccA family protein [Arthrobacter sp. YD2]UON92955.1 Bax inhibitor-1/YccA family protein [Arthrobacter zhangbolii]